MKQHTFRIRFSEEDNKWMGQCPSFMDLFVLHDDPAEALKGIMKEVSERSNGDASSAKSIFEQVDNMLTTAPGPFGKI